MCGIAGIIGAGARDDVLARMIAQIAHRGPDDEGVWVDLEAGVALGQRRLAIVDLSPAGHQPMLSANGRLSSTSTEKFTTILKSAPSSRRPVGRRRATGAAIPTPRP